jgi:hypothetical protein
MIDATQAHHGTEHGEAVWGGSKGGNSWGVNEARSQLAIGMLHVVEQDCDGAMYRVSFLFLQ